MTRRDYQGRTEGYLKDPHRHSWMPTPTRHIGEFESTEEVDDPRKRDNDTENRQQKLGPDICHEHDDARRRP